MTTSVIVKACCSSTKEVHVFVSSAHVCVLHCILQDGETEQVYAYDDREILVNEVLKQPKD
jgi:hypothetical protein